MPSLLPVCHVFRNDAAHVSDAAKEQWHQAVNQPVRDHAVKQPEGNKYSYDI